MWKQTPGDQWLFFSDFGHWIVSSGQCLIGFGLREWRNSGADDSPRLGKILPATWEGLDLQSKGLILCQRRCLLGIDISSLTMSDHWSSRNNYIIIDLLAIWFCSQGWKFFTMAKEWKYDAAISVKRKFSSIFPDNFVLRTEVLQTNTMQSWKKLI